MGLGLGHGQGVQGDRRGWGWIGRREEGGEPVGGQRQPRAGQEGIRAGRARLNGQGGRERWAASQWPVGWGGWGEGGEVANSGAAGREQAATDDDD